MADWDKIKNRSGGEKRGGELDDFWDVEKLIPDRPARRPMQPRREAPTTVEVEVPPKPTEAAEVGTPAPRPVAAAPLTVIAGEGTAHSDGMGEYGRPVPRPHPAPASNPRSAPLSGDVGVTAADTGRDSAATPVATEPAIGEAPYAPSSRTVPSGKRGEGATAVPLWVYEPDGVLLHRVRIYGWQANYLYFDSFVEDALRYHAMKPPKAAEKAPFFSYFPQYTQLSRRAEAWYLCWREYVRQGQYPDTDYAYVLLYLFELINLPVSEDSEGRERRDTMARVWMAYRKPFPQLDHYMCEWLCDYCLIHGLTAPVDLLAPALDSIIQEARLKEFYLSAAVRLPEEGGSSDTALQTARILMRHCCQYDYRKSKFAGGEHKELFDSTIPAAVAHVLPMLLGRGQGNIPTEEGRSSKPAVTMLDSTVSRDAFVGALCSHRNKRRIEVEYTSFSRSHELRFLMGDMVKHVENRLRSWIGVRSRLSVMSLPIPLRDALDAYLNPMEPPKSVAPVKKKEESRPAYEALYDLPRKAVSLEDAAAIEADSWETTRILVEAFEGEGNQPQPASERVPAVETRAVKTPAEPALPVDPMLTAPVSAPACGADESTAPAMDSSLALYAPFVKAALDGDSAALRAAAKALGKMPDALADEINALTADGEIGDIILEDDGMGGYTVIEDYRDAVLEMIEG